MTVFQIVFLVFCGTQAYLAAASFLRSRQGVSLLFASVWIGAMVVIAQPALTTTLARAVGIGRGVDLVTYSILVLLVWGHYQLFLRYKRLEDSLTQVVRELAIQQATGAVPTERSSPTTPLSGG